MTTVFLDTMIFLHYRQLNEIDFHSVVNADRVKVIIPRITIRELDKEKNLNTKNRIRTRAKKTLEKLDAWLSANTIRINVSIEYYAENPAIDFSTYSLNPEWNDDYLIATILQYKLQHPDEDIVLITQDSGPKFTALHIGLKCLEMPEGYKLPEEPEQHELESRELRKKLQNYENAKPELIAGFPNNRDIATREKFSLKAPPSTNENQIIEWITKLKEAYPKQYPQKEVDNSRSSLPYRKFGLTQGLDFIPESEYERYNRELNTFLSDYEIYLRAIQDHQAKKFRCLRFRIVVKNIGKAPAEDVDIQINFPDLFSLHLQKELPDAPKPPTPPTKPTSLIQKSLPGISTLTESLLYRPEMTDLIPISSFSINRANGYEIEDHSIRIKHGDTFSLPELFLIFNSYETASSFECEYLIRPANLHEPVSGKLSFIIEKE